MRGWGLWATIIGAIAGVVAIVVFVTGFTSLPALLNAVRPTETPEGMTITRYLERFSPYSTNLDFISDGTEVFELAEPLLLGEGDSFRADRILVDRHYRDERLRTSSTVVFALQCRNDRRCRSRELAPTGIFGGRSGFAGDIVVVAGPSSLEVDHAEFRRENAVNVYVVMVDVHGRRIEGAGFVLSECQSRNALSEGFVRHVTVLPDARFRLRIRTSCGRSTSSDRVIELNSVAGQMMQYDVEGQFVEDGATLSFRGRTGPFPIVD